MASKLILLVAILLASPWTSTCRSDDEDDNPDTLPCLERLMPCQFSLHSRNPPPECCSPLTEMLTGDPNCLCDIFHNLGFLNNLKTSQDGVLQLSKNCGAIARPDLCKHKEDTSPVTLAPTPLKPLASAPLIYSQGPVKSSVPRKLIQNMVVMLMVSGMYFLILAF